MSDQIQNKHYKNVERAPAEIGYLLQQLPANLSSESDFTPDLLKKIEAVESHATNASFAVLCGLIAVGDMLGTVMMEKESARNISADTLSKLGFLINHLSVELQFLHETESDMEFLRVEHAKKGGGDHA